MEVNPYLWDFYDQFIELMRYQPSNSIAHCRAVSLYYERGDCTTS
jgi:hypothetical protein